MKTLKNILAALVGFASLMLTAIAPWWAVWFILFPVAYSAAIYLIKTNTNYIKEY